MLQGSISCQRDSKSGQVFHYYIEWGKKSLMVGYTEKNDRIREIKSWALLGG